MALNGQNSIGEFPVSGSTWKEFESCLTTNKKLNKWKNQQFFLDP